MKNLFAILLFAFTFILFACKKEEEEKSIITYEIGREIAQSLSMVQLCIHETDRILANEYDVCPWSVSVSPVQGNYGKRYQATYGDGCTLPNGMVMHGDFGFTEFIEDPVLDLRRRYITPEYFVADTLSIDGVINMIEQSDSTWNVYFLAELQYEGQRKTKLEGYSKAQMTEGFGTIATTDDRWTISVDSMLITRSPKLETYAFTEPGSPLQSSSLCAWTTSGILNINNGDAMLQFGNGACDDHFWLDWSSGASVQINF